MHSWYTNRHLIRSLGVKAVLCALVLAGGVVGSAQVSSYGDKAMGENRGDELPKVLQKVGVAQHLNGQLAAGCGVCG